LATRAAAENEKGAVVLGFSPDFLAGTNWVLSTLITGLLGIFVATSLSTIEPTVLPALIVPALTAALVGGFAKLRGRRVIVLAQQKGRDTKENIRRNFGMVSPEGYRKATRLIDLASRFGLPVVTFVDSSGADPGIGSEERAQSEAIASCLTALTRAEVPVVASIIGEGGSGGALAIAKLLVIFYAVEMLVIRSEEKAVWVRVATASVLGALCLRSFETF